jgi:hypothetical protein
MARDTEPTDFIGDIGLMASWPDRRFNRSKRSGYQLCRDTSSAKDANNENCETERKDIPKHAYLLVVPLNRTRSGRIP